MASSQPSNSTRPPGEGPGPKPWSGGETTFVFEPARGPEPCTRVQDTRKGKGVQCSTLADSSAIPSSSTMVSGESVTCQAARFSRRWATEEVPGISRILGDRCSNHAKAVRRHQKLTPWRHEY